MNVKAIHTASRIAVSFLFTGTAFLAAGWEASTPLLLCDLKDGDARSAVGGQPANCYTPFTKNCPTPSGPCNTPCVGGLCTSGPAIRTPTPSYAYYTYALTGYSSISATEGFYCQIQYNCNCKPDANMVLQCNMVTPGDYISPYAQPYMMFGDENCPAS